MRSIERRWPASTRRRPERPIGFVLILLLALNGSIASAQSEPRERAIVPIEKGEPAPFSGDLFPPERSIRLGLRLERCQLKSEADLVRAVRLGEIALEYEKKRAEIQRKSDEARIVVLKDALSESSSFWRDPWFVAGVTAVVVGGVAAAIIAATRGDGSGVVVLENRP